ncbi:MAG: hypothetical protein REH83_02290 [Rickettsiella sp.]|nr:hypothetical protein [Rickettsiella sp.]
MKLLLLLSLIVTLTACTSFNDYIKTRKSQYLNSQDLGPLKLSNGLKLNQPHYIIPVTGTAKPVELPDLYPPTG